MKKNILVLLGVMFALTACGKEQAADVITDSEVCGVNSDEEVNYVEDTVLSTDLYTVTLPDEFKGKTRAIIDGEFISVFDNLIYFFIWEWPVSS